MKRFCLFIAFAALLTLGRLTAQAQTTPPANVIITLTGDNFTRQSTVFIGTAQFTPEFVSANMLRVSIPRTMLSSAQPNNVRVVNPSAGGGSSQGLPLVVACRTNEPPQLADFSMTMKTTSYSDLSESTDENNLAEGQKMSLRLARMQYVSRTIVSGTYFRNGALNVQMTLESATDNPFAEPLAAPNSTRMIRNIKINSAEGTAVFLSAANDTIFKSPIDSAPLRPITDYLQSVKNQLGLLTTQTVQTTQTAAQSSMPPPADTNIHKSIFLADAYKLGFLITKISSDRYSVTMTRSDSIALAPNEVVRVRVKIPEDIIERYEIFRDNLLHYRIRYQYEPKSPSHPVPRIRQTVSSSFYILEGLPMKQVVVVDYENYTVQLY